MKYISKYLAKEIRNKMRILSKLDENGDNQYRDGLKCESSFYCRKNETIAIEKNAQIHSFRIEHPELTVPFNVPKNTERALIKEGIENIQNAFYWAKGAFDKKDMSEDYIRNIAGYITPELYPGILANYRDTGTNITGASVTPPDPYKMRTIEMPTFTDKLTKKLTQRGPIGTIIAATYAHLHLVRIHPFVDGNGRTARVLQDTILSENSVPVPIIEAGERNTYYDFLDRAVYDWKHIKHSGELKHGATHGEKDFYNFMAGKVNVSIDKLLDCVRDKI
jgi:hypothetical protein